MELRQPLLSSFSPHHLFTRGKKWLPRLSDLLYALSGEERGEAVKDGGASPPRLNAGVGALMPSPTFN